MTEQFEKVNHKTTRIVREGYGKIAKQGSSCCGPSSCCGGSTPDVIVSNIGYTGNSCRSQMAEGFLRKYAGDHFDVYSAGLAPKPVHPLAIRVMDEIGIDTSEQESKGVDTVPGKQSINHAIFVCEQAEKNCPSIYPFALEKLSWPFEDPAVFEGNDDEVVDKFRQVRDKIDIKIQEWLRSVTIDDKDA